MHPKDTATEVTPEAGLLNLTPVETVAGVTAPTDKASGASEPEALEALAKATEGDAVSSSGPDAQNADRRRKPPRDGARPGRPGASPAVPAYRFEDVITGQLDADEEDASVEPLKRVLSAQPESPKLHKVLAQAGLGSRLEMEQLILEGRISVNAEPAHIGQRIQFGDNVKVNGKPIRVRIDPPPPRVIAYHKPTGEVVTHDDPQNRPTVFRRLPKLFQGKWQSVGRLDLNTEGLLLLTSSGELANKLMHPRFGLEREYAVRVLGALSMEEKKRLLEGVNLDDGVAQFSSLEAGGGEGANCWYRVTISEGRNREVRRMFEAVGHAVSRLIRIRYGAVMLPRGLKRGAFVELDEQDIMALTNALGRSEGRADPRREPRRDQPERGYGGDKRTGRGPRRDRGPARPDRAGQPAAPLQPMQARPPHDDAAGEPFDPYELQPPPHRNESNATPGAGRNANRRGGPNPAARGRGPGNFGNGPRPGQPPSNFGGGPGSKGKRRDDRNPRPDLPAGGAQPDPMKTSFGYIGADTFTRQRQAQGQRRGPGNGGGGSGGGGGGGGGPRRGGGNRNGGGGGRGSNR